VYKTGNFESLDGPFLSIQKTFNFSNTYFMVEFRLGFRLDGLCQQPTGATTMSEILIIAALENACMGDGDCPLDLFPWTTPATCVIPSFANLFTK
jgi:hypothetical protein